MIKLKVNEGEMNVFKDKIEYFIDNGKSILICFVSGTSWRLIDPDAVEKFRSEFK